MNLPSLSSLLDSLSMSDRAAMAVAHHSDDQNVDVMLRDADRWSSLYLQLPRPTQAVIGRIRRAGGLLPSRLLESIAGPFRTNLETISPRAFLTIHHPLTPFEQLFVCGVVWPITTPVGERQWFIPTEIERAIGAITPLFESEQPQPIIEATTPIPLDEILVTAACMAIDGRLTLQQHGRVSQVVLNRFNRTDISLVMLQWLTSSWIAAGVFKVEPTGLVPTPRLLEWLVTSAHERVQEMMRGWLQASWHEWDLGHTKKRPPALDVRYARRTLVHALLSHLPDEWCTWTSVIDSLRMGWPDLIRPANAQGKWIPPVGWPATWATEDALFIEYMLRGPAYWLGLIAWDDEGVYLRRTAVGGWIAGVNAPPVEEDALPAVLEHDGSIIVVDDTNYYARVQLHRIADWRDASTAQISPMRVRKAIANGMSSHTYLEILQSVLATPIPHAQKMIIQSWAQEVAQVSMQSSVILKTSSADVLIDIMHNRQLHLSDYQVMNDTTIAVAPADASYIVRKLRQLGYVVDVQGLKVPQFDETELALLAKIVQEHAHHDESMRQLHHKIIQLRQKGK